MSEELREKVIAYLGKVDKAKNREVATALGAPKKEVDAVINQLAKDDLVEFLYLGTSYVKLKGK